MFSGIRWVTLTLNLYDLYQLKLNAELVTLSGCATGMNVVTAGDELLGLIRGLLYAGAQSLFDAMGRPRIRPLRSSWSIFYSRLQDGSRSRSALRGAMPNSRERHPHPYHWAPFTLIGKVSPV